MSAAATFSPPTFNMSLSRLTNVTVSSACWTAMSPVWNHPSGSIVALEAAGSS
jgi:hypothetical protein